MFPVRINGYGSWIAVCIAISFACLAAAEAQPGSLDPTFNPGRGPNHVTGGSGQGVLLQPDGKFLVGGLFDGVNLTRVAPIVRFNSNGSLDTTFNASILQHSAPIDVFVSVAPLALLPNGQVIVGGTFDTTDGTLHHLVRLNANGSLDPNFDPKIARSDPSQSAGVFQAAVQVDGKILIRGDFDTVNNVARNSLARLNADGTLDTAFNPNLSGFLVTIALQADGKILVARKSNSLVRLNSNGTVDATFHSSPVVGLIGSVLVQNNGKIVVSGFSNNGIPEDFSMSRLNEDGSVDSTFQPSGSLGIALQNDDKILSYARGFQFQRLNANGTLDSSFHPGDRLPAAIAQQPDGKLILAGGFYPAPYGVDRILPDGSRDPNFDVGLGLTTISNVIIERAQLLPSGKIVIAGEFNYVGLLPRNKIAVLNSDGSPDANFDAGNVTDIDGVDNPVHAVAVQPDGKIIVAFYNLVVRLNQNGSIDSGFDYHPGSLALVGAVRVQNDGKILVGTETGLIRLKRDGTSDPSFDAGQSGGGVSSLLLQSDGKIVVSRRGLIRLNQDGSLDSSFHSGLGEFNFAIPLELLPDGKILVSYLTSSISGFVLVRLNPDGSRDDSFTALDGGATSIAVDQTSIYVTNNNAVRRLSLNGVIDSSFHLQFSSNADIRQLLLQPNGQLIIAGGFDEVNKVSRNSIARVNGNAPQKAANISTRAHVASGEAVEIGGFIITGTARKDVLIRALGPSIESGGTHLPETLSDPVLELHRADGAIIRFNDDWRAFFPTEIINTGLAPMNEKESAIHASLLPGAYTAVLRGKNGASGQALLEIYDLDPSVDSKLANISTRGFVGTGDDVLIGGFIFRGSQPEKFVVRAIGPSLSAVGIVNPLVDPVLELHNQAGELVATNDDWKQTQQSELSMSGLAPTNDRESAIIATLPTGVYTAIVRGHSNETGVALVEVYDVP